MLDHISNVLRLDSGVVKKSSNQDREDVGRRQHIKQRRRKWRVLLREHHSETAASIKCVSNKCENRNQKYRYNRHNSPSTKKIREQPANSSDAKLLHHEVESGLTEKRHQRHWRERAAVAHTPHSTHWSVENHEQVAQPIN